jgi:uncharacterized protein (UPF0335 family)
MDNIKSTRVETQATPKLIHLRKPNKTKKRESDAYHHHHMNMNNFELIKP